MGARAAIVLAAGRSRRMNSDVPKVLHHVLGRPLLSYVLTAARAAGAERLIAVVSPEHRDAIASALQPEFPELVLAVQADPRGTGHAVLQAAPALTGERGTTLIMLGDAPCVSPRSLQALVQGHSERRAAVSLLSGRAQDPTGYGRIVRGPDGDLSAIVEHKDASEHTRAIDEINSGVFALEWEQALPLLESLTPSPETGELYLTQIVELARAHGHKTCAILAADEEDVLGVNDRAQLARVTAILRERINASHMANGVTIVDPNTTFIDARATIGRDAMIQPFTMIQGACTVEEGAVIGPFTHLREAEIGAGARVGNFVEVVRSRLGSSSRALHLAYVGDAELERDVNVGAGTVFANWDGARHHRTTVGAGSQLGSNTTIVAPSQVGASCKTGAGAVVVKATLPAGSTWVGVPARSRATSGGER